MERSKPKELPLIRHKRSISGPQKLSTSCFLDKPTAPSSVNLLEKVSKRHAMISESLDPHLAAKVIKEYVVPLFHCKSTQGLGQSNILEKFTIIEKFRIENEYLKDELEKIKLSCFHFDQEKFELKSELDYYKNVLFNVEMHLECVNFTSNQLVKHNSRLEKHLEYGTFYKNTYDIMKNKHANKNRLLSEQLSEEKNKNHIRFCSYFHIP